MIHRLGFLMVLCVASVGCGKADSVSAPEIGLDGEPETAAISDCLDPKDPAVHYQSDDPVECDGLALECASKQWGFDNSCGCGCVDKGALRCPEVAGDHVTWVSHDPAACGSEKPSCAASEVAFNNGCGCGCIQH